MDVKLALEALVQTKAQDGWTPLERREVEQFAQKNAFPLGQLDALVASVTPKTLTQFRSVAGPLALAESPQVSPVADAGVAQQAKQLAALHTLLSHTTVDVDGRLTFKGEQGNAVEQARVNVALSTLFGAGLKLDNNLTFDWAKRAAGTSKSARWAMQVLGVYRTLKVDVKSVLTLRKGQVTGEVQAKLTQHFGPRVVVFQGQVIFDDRGLAQAKLSSRFSADFGPGRLDTVLKTVIDRTGLAQAELFAAFKGMVGGAKVQADGTLTFDPSKLTAAQFEAQIKRIFPRASFEAKGVFKWEKSGASASLTAKYRMLFESLELNVASRLQLKAGKVSGDIAVELTGTLGRWAVVMNNRVVFDNNMLQQVNLDQRFTTTFGAVGSLRGSLKATIEKSGIKSAQLVAALHTVVSNTTVDINGMLTFKGSDAERVRVDAALSTLLRPGLKLDNKLTFDWAKAAKGDSVSAQWAAQLLGVYRSVEVDVSSALVVKKGQVSGTVQAKLTKYFGPLVAVAQGQVVFDDSKFVQANLSNRFTGDFGPGRLDAVLKTVITRKGLQKAELFAAFKMLRGSTTTDAEGRLSIQDGKITVAEFRLAVKTIFGSGATLDSEGRVDWTPENGFTAKVVSSFKAVYGRTQVSADGEVRLTGEGRVSADLRVHARKLFADGTQFVSGEIVVKDSKFISLDIEASLIEKFGPAGSIRANLSTKFNAEGVKQATLFLAAKRVAGSLTLQASGELRVVDGRPEEVRAALSILAGENVELRNNVVVGFTDKGRFKDAAFRSDFLMLVKQTTVELGGDIRVARGEETTARLNAAVSRVFGGRAETRTSVSGATTVVFNAGGIDIEEVRVAMNRTFGSASLDASLKFDGKVRSTLALASFKTLKALSGERSLQFNADGSVRISKGTIDRAELSALIGLAVGENVNITSDGKLVYENGKPAAELGLKLKATIGSTTLDAQGSLKMADGTIGVEGKLTAMFEGSKVLANGTIVVEGVDKVQLALALKSKDSRFDMNGRLRLERGKVTSASLTSTLVSTGTDTTGMNLSGVLSLSDSATAADLIAKFRAGILKGVVGIGAKSWVQAYTPAASDLMRKRAVRNGGHWSERAYEVHATADAGFKVQVGSVPVNLGFKIDGAKTQIFRALSIHPTAEDAMKRAPVSVLRMPRQVSDYLAMRLGEQVSRSGTATIGVSGSIGLGYGSGVAKLSVGGTVYHKMTGSMVLEVTRLEGQRFSVKVRRGKEKIKGSSLGLVIGLDGEKIGDIPGIGGLNKQLKPAITRLAEISFKRSWDSIEENRAVFEFEFDLSKPTAVRAFERVVNLDLSQAQYMSRYLDSGVHMASRLRTHVKAEIDKTEVSVPGLKYEEIRKWVKTLNERVSAEGFERSESLERLLKQDPLVRWRRARSSSTRFEHRIGVPREKRMLPSGDDTTSNGVVIVNAEPAPDAPLSLIDAKSALKLNFDFNYKYASKSQIDKNVSVLTGALDYLDLLEHKNTSDILALKAFLGSPLVLDAKTVALGLGDKRFAGARFSFAAALDSEGLLKVFRSGASSAANKLLWRKESDFLLSYLDASAVTGATHPLSTSALLQSIRSTLSADVRVLRKDGQRVGFVISRNGKALGTILQTQLDAWRIKHLDYERTIGLGASGAQLGTWLIKPPAEILNIDHKDPAQDEAELFADNQLLKRARSYAVGMVKIGKLVRSNRLPRIVGEDSAAYRERMAQARVLPPEEYYRRIEAHLREIQGRQDWHLALQLSILKLAGPEWRSVSVKVDMPPAVMSTMKERGERNVQRFGALTVLTANSELLGDVLAVTVPPAQRRNAVSAVHLLFGTQVKMQRTGDTLYFSDLSFTSPEHRQAFTTLLDCIRHKNGKAMPALWLSPQRLMNALTLVLGPGVARNSAEDGVVFDNTGHQRVDIDAALKALFSPAVRDLRTLKPQAPVGAKFSGDRSWDFQMRVTGKTSAK